METFLIMLQRTLWLSPWLESYFVRCPPSSMFLGSVFTMDAETLGWWNGVSPQAQPARSLLLLLPQLLGLADADDAISMCEENM